MMGSTTTSCGVHHSGGAPTYADGESPKYLDTVMVDPLDRGRVGIVLQVEAGAARVFVTYDDYAEPSRHWCSVDRCELVRRR